MIRNKYHLSTKKKNKLDLNKIEKVIDINL